MPVFEQVAYQFKLPQLVKNMAKKLLIWLIFSACVGVIVVRTSLTQTDYKRQAWEEEVLLPEGIRVRVQRESVESRTVPSTNTYSLAVLGQAGVRGTSEWRQEGNGRFALRPLGLYRDTRGRFRLITALAGGDERLSGLPSAQTCSGYFVFLYDGGSWVYEPSGPSEADAVAFESAFNLSLGVKRVEGLDNLPVWLKKFDRKFKANAWLQGC